MNVLTLTGALNPNLAEDSAYHEVYNLPNVLVGMGVEAQSWYNRQSDVLNSLPLDGN